jgi:hypothetical protein
MPEKIEDEVVDFSNYLRPEDQANTDTAANSPIQSIETIEAKKLLTKRVWILISVVLILIIAQMVIYYIGSSRKLDAPDGYRYVKPVDGPIRMEKLK